MQRMQKMWPWLGLSLIALWPLLIINKGFDLTDTGFYLAGYRYAFSHPEFNSFTYVLSTWLGGLIYHMVPFGQMLAIKIAVVAMYAAVAYWSFVILREHFPDWLVLASLAMASIYTTLFFYSASYNTFSYFILSAAIFLLYRGLRRDRPGYLWAAAVLLGLNVFTRLPNLLQWALAAVPFWYYWFCLGRRLEAVKLTLRFVLVLVLTCFLFLCLYTLVTGVDTILNQLDGLLGTARGDDRANHSAMGMWDRYTIDGIRVGYSVAAKYGLKIIGGALALLLSSLVFHRSKVIAAALALGGVSLGLLVGLFVDINKTNVFAAFYSFGGVLIALAGLLYYHQKDPLLSALSGIALLVLLAMSVGSDFGVDHYLYYTHLSVTVCLGLVYKFWLSGAEWIKNHSPGRHLSDIRKNILVGLNLPLWFMFGLGCHQLLNPGFKETMMDAPYALTKTPVEGVPVLAGMRTNAQRAERLSRLSKELEPFQDMEIVVLGQCPLCLLLTDSKPFLNYLWPDLWGLEGLEFERLLYEGLKQGRTPLVLVGVANRDPWRLDWKDHHKERLLNNFLKKQNYVRYYNGELFKIYLPPDRVPDEARPPDQP